jgi:hypothetical protein
MRVFKTILISILICLTLFGTVAAVNIEAAAYGTEAETGEIQPRIEETKWYYKNVDGVLYMRLWSITYGKWLTDWIIV